LWGRADVWVDRLSSGTNRRNPIGRVMPTCGLAAKNSGRWPAMRTVVVCWGGQWDQILETADPENTSHIFGLRVIPQAGAALVLRHSSTVSAGNGLRSVPLYSWAPQRSQARKRREHNQGIADKVFSRQSASDWARTAETEALSAHRRLFRKKLDQSTNSAE